MRERVRQLLAGEEAWIVGGAVRDSLLGRFATTDVDVVCREPELAARRYARRFGGAPFPLSGEHGAWRVASGEGTVDFTPLHGTIDEDLARRDFTVNAMAEPVAGGELLDPHGGRGDLQLRLIRHVSDGVFGDDPLRLLRAVRLADRLDFSLAGETALLIRARAHLVRRAAGERILAELDQLSATGWSELESAGLLQQLGGSLPDVPLDRSARQLWLVQIFGERLFEYPLSGELRRFARTMLRAERPGDGSPRAIHRFRRATEPWSLEALSFVGAADLREAVLSARRRDPAGPLLRGDELGLPPGPEIGRLLELIDEERAVGTVTTREQALELVRREARPA